MKRRVVLIDVQEHSRNGIEELLRPLGLEMLSLGTLEFPYEGWDEHNTPHLVIVSSEGAISPEYHQCIMKLLASGVKMIIIAGHTDWAEARSLFLAGAYDVVTRNSPNEDLARSVQSALGEM